MLTFDCGFPAKNSIAFLFTNFHNAFLLKMQVRLCIKTTSKKLDNAPILAEMYRDIKELIVNNHMTMYSLSNEYSI